MELKGQRGREGEKFANGLYRENITNLYLSNCNNKNALLAWQPHSILLLLNAQLPYFLLTTTTTITHTHTPSLPSHPNISTDYSEGSWPS